jgi:hypothetical protein
LAIDALSKRIQNSGVRTMLRSAVITEWEHPNASLNLFPHPQPLSHLWERGDIILVPLLPKMGEGVRG